MEENEEKSSPRGKRNRFTFEEKQMILEESKNLTSQEICAKYGLSESIFRRWKLSEDDETDNSATATDTRAMKKVSKMDELDDELIKWFSDCFREGIEVTEPMVCEQALVINSRIGGSAKFKASQRWLEKWKKRTDIENLNFTLEELSADEEADNLVEQPDVVTPVKKRKYRKRTHSEAATSQDDSVEKTSPCSGKRKRQRYTYEEKSIALKALETQCLYSVSQKYKINEKLLLKWQKNKAEIETATKNKYLCDKKSQQNWTKDIDEELFNWFKETRNKGISINGPRLKEKALEINKAIGGKDDFKASEGWLTGWKNRKNVKFVSTKMNSLDVEIAVEDKKKIQLVKLPVKTFVCSEETQAPAALGCNADASLQAPMMKNLPESQRNAGDELNIKIRPESIVKVIKLKQPPPIIFSDNTIVTATAEFDSLDNQENNEIDPANSIELPVPKLIRLKPPVKKQKNLSQSTKKKQPVKKQKKTRLPKKVSHHVDYEVLEEGQEKDDQDINMINPGDRCEIIEIDGTVSNMFTENSTVIDAGDINLSADDENIKINITDTGEVAVAVPVPVHVPEPFSLEKLTNQLKNTELPSGWNFILLEHFLLIGHWDSRAPAKKEIHVYDDGSFEIFFDRYAITVPGMKPPSSTANLLFNMKILEMILSCDGSGLDDRHSDKCKRYVFCTKSFLKYGHSRCLACAKYRKNRLQSESRDQDTRYKLRWKIKLLKKQLEAEVAKNQKLESEQARHRTSTDCNVRMLGGTTQQIHALNAPSAAAPTS